MSNTLPKAILAGWALAAGFVGSPALGTTAAEATRTAASREGGKLTALECGSLIDTVEGQRLTDVRILIRDERIEAVGRGLAIPPGAEVLDLSEHTCLPGLVDLHTHLMITLDRSVTQNYLERSSAEKTLLALRNAQKMLQLGFTTVRVPGDLEFQFGNIALRDAFRRGDFAGPRMLVAPHALGPTGGHSDLNELAEDTYQIAGTTVPAGAAAMREAVRREIKGGADWIKVMATGGVMSQNDDPEVQAFSDEEFQALAAEAHRHKKRITAHAHGNAGIVAAAKAGFDSIEHGTMIERSGIDAMLEHGTVLIPTAYVIDWIVAQGTGGGITEDNYRKALLVQGVRNKGLLQAYRAGVPIGFGTDQIFPHEESPREFASMVKVGIEPIDAIRAATSVAAKLLGLEDEIGSIGPGMAADIIAVPGDPLQHISVMERITFVMKGGKLIRGPQPGPGSGTEPTQ